MRQPERGYVCWNNVARSQFAMEFDNRRNPGIALSAGLHVDEDGGLVEDWIKGSATYIEAMRELNPPIDISKNKRTLFTEEWAGRLSRVIFVLNQDQFEEVRGLQVPGTEFEWWPIADPLDTTIEKTRSIRDGIAERVGALSLCETCKKVDVQL